MKCSLVPKKTSNRACLHEFDELPLLLLLLMLLLLEALDEVAFVMHETPVLVLFKLPIEMDDKRALIFALALMELHEVFLDMNICDKLVGRISAPILLTNDDER